MSFSLYTVVIICCFVAVSCTIEQSNIKEFLTIETNCSWAGQSLPLKHSDHYAIFVVNEEECSTIPLTNAMWKAIGWVPLFVVDTVKGKGERQNWEEMMRMSGLVKSLEGILIYLPDLLRTHSPQSTHLRTQLHAASIAAALLKVEQEDTRMLVPWGDALAWSLLSRRIKLSDLKEGAHNHTTKHYLREVADKVGRSYGVEGTAKAWKDALLSLSLSPTTMKDINNNSSSSTSRIRGMHSLLSSPHIKEGAVLLHAMKHNNNIDNDDSERDGEDRSHSHYYHTAKHPFDEGYYYQHSYRYSYDRVRKHLPDPSHVRVLDVFYNQTLPPRVFWFVVTHQPQQRPSPFPSSQLQSSHDDGSGGGSAMSESRIEGCMETWLDEDVHIITRLSVNHSRVLPILRPGIDTLPSHRQTIKFFTVWDYLYRELLNKYDWFVKVDDDTYLRKEYMLWDLIKEDRRDGIPHRRGQHLCQDNPKLLPPQYIPSTANGSCYCTGPAYALNKEALRVLGEHIGTCKEEYKKLKYEDMAIGLCMNKHGIPPCNGHSHFINTLTHKNKRMSEEDQWMWYHKADTPTMKRLRLCDSFGIFG